ncbi:MAG: hypothetical protein RMK52_01065 [Chitinophagales bacterium]|nr:hypothetical protein [Chitinophagales bacterium]MDW8392815.1 hypothetical protein [Chitinophagales bacterium]
MKKISFKNALAATALFASLTFSGTLLAQGRGEKMTPTPDYSQMSRDEVKKDVESRMQKFDEAYRRLKEKESQVKNEQLKADLNRMLSKMDEIKAEMNKPEPDRAKVRSSMEELRKMREELKAKYGEQREARKQKAQSGENRKEMK